MPIIETKGSMSSQGYGQFARSGAAPAYIEDVFSTWLYTGNNSTQTITNGIDLASPTKGGLVWIKFRNSADWGHVLTDTNRGASSQLISNSSAAQTTEANRITSFDATGFSIGGSGFVNQNNGLYVSWTFRRQPKFFDMVTYTGNGVAGRTVAHNLGSTPGFVLIKNTSGANSWVAWHRSRSGETGVLNSSAAFSANQQFYLGNDVVSINPTSTLFTVATDGGVNANGNTYVAYLFAHDAGGFGASGTDNVISCGSFTTDGSGSFVNVNLGWEPQFTLFKAATGTPQDWVMFDTMRGMSQQSGRELYPNLSSAEADGWAIRPTATGFSAQVSANRTYIYIAIRRGPMRTPTSGTSVFTPQLGNAIGTANLTVTNFPPDVVMSRSTQGGINRFAFSDKLRGAGRVLITDTQAESSAGGITGYLNNGISLGADTSQFYINNSSYNPYSRLFFSRAPGFFDVVCYTGTGVARTVNHNLGVVPEMMIVKTRSGSGLGWYVYSTGLGPTKINQLNQDAGSFTSAGFWNDTAPTSSVFSLGDNVGTNGSGNTQVAYLFASCPGVSKVGSYTGTGSTLQVNCGFTAGARFVLIKRTDEAGDWYVWDSARGIVAGNDPYLLLNSTAAEVTNTDWVDTLATGFEVSNAGSNLVNVNGASYIFLSVS